MCTGVAKRQCASVRVCVCACVRGPPRGQVQHGVLRLAHTSTVHVCLQCCCRRCLCEFEVLKVVERCRYRRVSLPEWSKGLRSGRNVFGLVGSNPTADILLRNTTNNKTVFPPYCIDSSTHRLIDTRLAPYTHWRIGQASFTVDTVATLHRCTAAPPHPRTPAHAHSSFLSAHTIAHT